MKQKMEKLNFLKRSSFFAGEFFKISKRVPKLDHPAHTRWHKFFRAHQDIWRVSF